MMRPVMATTILVGLEDIACGLAGSGMRIGALVEERLCKVRVLSHEAETRISWILFSRGTV